MNPRLLALVIVVVACTQGDEPPVTTVAPTTSPVETTVPEVTTSIEPEVTTTTLAPLGSVSYQLVADISFPVQLTARPGDEVAYLITKDGRMWALQEGALRPDPVLDISSRVQDSGEQGLLSIALHPEDPERLFLHYSAGNGDTVVAEYRFVDPFTVDPESERVLLRLSQPAGNHNGGMIQFGPEGSLYLGLGDGGGANDQFGHGQDRDTLLGSLVTLRVDGEPQPEVFSYGLRNPWRFWIEDDLIYIADVGQNRFEEVSVTPLEPGLNYGWPVMEGDSCFRPAEGCDSSGLVIPQVSVAHGDQGTCSITGGFVYRGEQIPEIAGHYFYSDYCGGYLRSFRFVDGELADETHWTDQVGVPGRVVGFGLDGAGEMYVATTEALLKVVAVRG